MRSILLAALVLFAPVANAETFFDLKATTIDGKVQDLAAYKGKVVLVVNTASQCGFTPQYEGLEKLYEANKDKGLVILGFPSNEFGGQEPGSSEEIKKFCSLRFHVQFPMFQKISTKGTEQSPVYAFLTKKHEAPQWNFHKYLIGKDGQVKGAFKSAVKPESAELAEAIRKALAE